MSPALRALLLIGSFATLYMVGVKIKKKKIQISDSIFWVGLSLLLILNAVFPSLAAAFASLFGFVATSNFIFLLVIAILLIKEFSNAQEISRLRHKTDELAQELALRDAHQHQSEEKR